MKIRTALISIVVSGALVAGVVYAAYYTLGGQTTPVEVVPVKNVDESYWFSDGYYYDESTMSGQITSQVSQTVVLDSEYSIDEIYVSEGDEVTVGTPLFSYDMTLQEIEVESQDIQLQTYELQLKKLEKQLAKYQNTAGTASLETTSSTMTTSSAEAILDASSDSSGSTSSEDSVSESSDAGTDDAGLVFEIEDIETVDPDTWDEETVLRTSVARYEALMTAIKEMFDEYGDELASEDIGEALTSAVEFYRKNLADEVEEEIEDEEGNTTTVKNYTLKDSVTDILSSSEIKTLKSCASLMDRYHAAYVDMLIREAAAMTEEQQKEALETAREEYENLSGDAREYVTLLDEFEEMEEQIEDTTPAESETESESETTDLPQSETESETSNPSQSETESETTDPSQSETESETTDPSQSETESEITDPSQSETESEITDPSQSETESETADPSQSETESESESELESELADIDTDARIASFLLMVDNLLSETATPELEDYQNAIAFYQMYLADPPADIAEEGNEATMADYSLSEETLACLAELGTKGAALQTELTGGYREVCIAYVKYWILSLDAETMTREELTAAQDAYDQLGISWALLLVEEEPSIANILVAYDMILDIQELDLESEDFLEQLDGLYEEYLSLTEDQLALVWNLEDLLDYLETYGFLEEETESEYYDWYDDYDYDYDYDYDSGLTASKLNELIAELETEIQEYELYIREAELNLSKAERVLDQKVVTSTVDGIVVTIGDENGNTDDDDDYFVRVSSDVGLYVKGVISERALDTISVGDVISGIDDYGESFTAVITEISDYPASDWSDYVWSYSENTSYYSFYALIDDPEDITEGYAELTLSTTYAETTTGIYLEAWFVRTDSAGNNYVYIQGEDGTLEIRYVTLGTSVSDYYVNIIGGLSSTDLIAFPYGDNVYEGAPTTEVDYLVAAYG